MSEQRFTIQASGMYLHLPIFDNDVEMADGDVCILLNEQQATITKLKELNGDKGKRIISLIRTNKTLKEENEHLRQIIKDIVCATDETYTKNTSMFKVTVVFDGKMYNQIRSCLYE